MNIHLTNTIFLLSPVYFYKYDIYSINWSQAAECWHFGTCQILEHNLSMSFGKSFAYDDKNEIFDQKQKKE